MGILYKVNEGCCGLIQYHKTPIVHPCLTVNGIPQSVRVRMVAERTFHHLILLRFPCFSAKSILPHICLEDGGGQRCVILLLLWHPSLRIRASSICFRTTKVQRISEICKRLKEKWCYSQWKSTIKNCIETVQSIDCFFLNIHRTIDDNVGT